MTEPWQTHQPPGLAAAAHQATLSDPGGQRDIHIHVHVNDHRVDELLGVARAILTAVQQEGSTMSAEMDSLTESVGKETSVADSAIALIKGLSQQITDAGTDKEKLAALTSQLDQESKKLVDAVSAGTPNATIPTPPALNAVPIDPNNPQGPDGQAAVGADPTSVQGSSPATAIDPGKASNPLPDPNPVDPPVTPPGMPVVAVEPAPPVDGAAPVPPAEASAPVDSPPPPAP